MALIMVPSANSGQHSHTLADGTPTLRGGHDHNVLSDYLDFYTPFSQNVLQWNRPVSDFERKYHFWNFAAEITEWVRSNCLHDVLVQKQDSCWVFYFYEEKQVVGAFDAFVSTPRQTFFAALMDENLYEEILEWMKENLQGDHEAFSTMHYISGIRSSRKTFFVRDDKEAVLFRLRWSDQLNFQNPSSMRRWIEGFDSY